MCGCVLIHLTSQHALHYPGNSSLDKLVTPDPVYPHSNQELNADRKKQKPFSHPTPTMISHTRAGTAAVQILRSGSQQKSQEQNLPHSKKKKNSEYEPIPFSTVIGIAGKTWKEDQSDLRDLGFERTE